MRLSSIALWSVAAGLLIGPAAALARAPAGDGIQLDWSVPDLSTATPGSAPTGGSGDEIAPDLRTELSGYDFRSGPSLEGMLLAAAPATSPVAVLGRNESFVNATIALASDLHIHMGAIAVRPDLAALPPVSSVDQLQLSRAANLDDSRTILAGADWDIASWGGLGIAASQTQQTGFGWPAALEFQGAKAVTAFGVSVHLNFGDGWITTFTYDEGRTQLDLRPNALSVANEAKNGSGFDVAISKTGLFGEDALGLALIRPMPPNANGLAPGGNYSGLLGSQISLSSATPETDFQLDYETSFNGNITLQANAGYQTNVAGQNGARAISVLSRAKINF